jgi:type IV pilus assembly protein PilB
MARKRLGEMLMDSGLLNEESLRTALAEQRRWGGTLGKTLVELKLINEDELVMTVSRQLNMPIVDLDVLEIPQPVVELVSADSCIQHSIMPFAQPMKFLDVAMVDPTNLGIIDELRIRTQLNIRSYLAGPKMIERAIAKYYRRGFGVTRKVSADTLEIDSSPQKSSSAGLRVPVPETDKNADGIRPFPRSAARDTMSPVSTDLQTAEIVALQNRLSALEALVERDEGVLRKILSLMVEKGLATREEVLERLK